jgi:hypothetical protein
MTQMNRNQGRQGPQQSQPQQSQPQQLSAEELAVVNAQGREVEVDEVEVDEVDEGAPTVEITREEFERMQKLVRAAEQNMEYRERYNQRPEVNTKRRLYNQLRSQAASQMLALVRRAKAEGREITAEELAAIPDPASAFPGTNPKVAGNRFGTANRGTDTRTGEAAGEAVAEKFREGGPPEPMEVLGQSGTPNQELPESPPIEEATRPAEPQAVAPPNPVRGQGQGQGAQQGGGDRRRR